MLASVALLLQLQLLRPRHLQLMMMATWICLVTRSRRRVRLLRKTPKSPKRIHYETTGLEIWEDTRGKQGGSICCRKLDLISRITGQARWILVLYKTHPTGATAKLAEK